MVMKKVFFNAVAVVSILMTMVYSVKATDLPVSYRTPFFQGDLRRNVTDWATELSVRYGGGSNKHDRNKALFGLVGSVDLMNLGSGVDSIATKTKTNQYWGTNGSFSTAPARAADSYDGYMNFAGEIRVRELSLGLKQNLYSGFFIELLAPLRQVQLNNIRHLICGAPVVNNVSLEDFMQNDFPTILQENGFVGQYDRNFHQTKFTELLVAVGWQGYDDTSFNIIDAAAGSLQLGFIAPLGDKNNEDRLFSIPLGYNGAYGCFVRAKAEVAFWNVLMFGAQAGANILFPYHRDIRMRTNGDQSGWVALEKGRAKVDCGTIWDLVGYFKVQNVLPGFAVVVGYSYTEQENTDLNVEDDAFLKDTVQAALNHTGPYARNTYAMMIDKNDIVNTDKRYHGWDQHVLHTSISYDAALVTSWWLAPKVALEYSCYLTGRRTFMTNMLAGNCGLRSSWTF